MTLQIYVNGQEISLSPSQKNKKFIADSKNYLKVKFNLQSEEWKNGKLTYALFSHAGKTYKKILGVEEGCGTNECYVAPEVIKGNNFQVALFNDDLITTNNLTINIDPSGYTSDIENQKATPDVMEQMNSLMYKYASLCNEMLKECRQIRDELKGGK